MKSPYDRIFRINKQFAGMDAVDSNALINQILRWKNPNFNFYRIHKLSMSFVEHYE